MIARHRAVLAALIAVAVAVAACGGAVRDSAPAPTADPGTGTTGPTPVPDPGSGVGAGGGGTGGGGTGGGSAPNPGPGGPGQGGIGLDPGPDPLDPNREPVLVAPVPNVRDTRDVGATTLDATVDGRHVTARVTWWSGVDPCTALAGIAVARGERDITLTIREGSAAGPDVMCTAQAIYKAAIVDLGELEPGRWTIRTEGEAPPVEVTVAG